MGNTFRVEKAHFECAWAYTASQNQGVNFNLHLYSNNTFKLNWIRENPTEYYRWTIFEGTFERSGAGGCDLTFTPEKISYICKGRWVMDPAARIPRLDFRGIITPDSELSEFYRPGLIADAFNPPGPSGAVQEANADPAAAPASSISTSPSSTQSSSGSQPADSSRASPPVSPPAGATDAFASSSPSSSSDQPADSSSSSSSAPAAAAPSPASAAAPAPGRRIPASQPANTLQSEANYPHAVDLDQAVFGNFESPINFRVPPQALRFIGRLELPAALAPEAATVEVELGQAGQCMRLSLINAEVKQTEGLRLVRENELLRLASN